MTSTLRQGVKLAAAGVDGLRRRVGITVLIYHRIAAGTGASVDLPLSLFADQLSHITAEYRPVTIDDVADLVLETRPPEGPTPLCVTFDDGSADFVDRALPALVDARVPVVIYIVTDNVESGKRFSDGTAPVSWAGLRDAVSTGLVTVGSHTHTHRLLDRVDDRVARDELDRSLELIESRLGIRSRHFAYPKALLGSPDAEMEVRRRFRTAVIAKTRPNTYGSTDLHRITRSPVQLGDGMRWFARKAAGGMALEDDIRRLVNRRRYRSAVT